MSAEIAAATWSARFSSSSRAASSRLARSVAGVADQDGNAARAAAHRIVHVRAGHPPARCR